MHTTKSLSADPASNVTVQLLLLSALHVLESSSTDATSSASVQLLSALHVLEYVRSSDKAFGGSLFKTIHEILN